MDFQFTTSSCHHHGTIKPVKSTTGKHAGKLMCRIRGPNITAHNGVKTIYSDPYVGAAKAAIAKFLHITVAEVVALPSSSHGGSTPISAGQRGQTQTTPQTVHGLGEFDDDDEEEFANFDLNAAVSSAQKQSPCKSQQKMSPSNPYNYNGQQNNIPNNQTAYKNDGGKGGNSSTPTSSKAKGSSKPPQYPKPTGKLKSPNLNSSQKHSNVSTAKVSSSKSSDQKEQQKLDGLRKETEGLRLEIERLQREVGLAKQQKEDLEKETHSVREEKERLKKESKAAKQERDKMKGQTRAVREEYDQLRVSIKEKKEKSKNDACKGKDSEGKSNVEGTSEPPAKKRKAGKQVKSGGAIIKSMKVADLKEEAVARGIELKEVSKMNKGELLNLLVVGSTCITKTDAWGEVLRLREKFEKERRLAEDLKNQRQEEMYRKQEQEERERQKKLKAAREKERASELSSQVEKHTYHFPTVHPCKLAETKDLLFHGAPRSYNASCSECNRRGVFYTCEKCDFDICLTCFTQKTMTPEQKKAEAKKKAALDRQRQEEQAERRRLEEEEEEEHRKKWDPNAQFKSKIVHPTAKNLDPDGNKKKGFTVWCSDGYGYDGWHSYEGPPDKEFDSTYKTKEDANARARYLFYWKNLWGLEPENIHENEVDKTVTDGLVTYVVTPDDSSTWTVAVVPDAAYAYMEHATLRRHGHDSEHGNTASDYGYVSGSFV